MWTHYPLLLNIATGRVHMVKKGGDTPEVFCPWVPVLRKNAVDALCAAGVL